MTEEEKDLKIYRITKSTTVDSLISDHTYRTINWSLTGGGHLREKSRKAAQTELINIITYGYYLKR